MAIHFQKRIFPYLVYIFLWIALYFFFIKYVPLVKSFQMILAPVLILVFLTPAVNKTAGILLFVFCFPLINNLPYFFGIHESVPHAPTALVLFLFFSLGWILNTIYAKDKRRLDNPLFRPMVLITGILVVSGVVTLFRHGHFFPIKTSQFHDLVVNVYGVTSGGAMMSTVLSLLNYLSGFFFFLILFNSLKSRKSVIKVLSVLSFSYFISLVFSLIQIYHSSSFGNTPFWNSLGRINATYKDPNAFGAVVSSFFPVLLGLAFFVRKKTGKLYFFLLMLMSLFVFAPIGSRSGLLALGLSVLVFFLLFLSQQKSAGKKKIAYLLIFGLIIGIIAAYFMFFAQDSNLSKRIGWSLNVLAEEDSFHKFFTKKLYFWEVAARMIKAYPLSGVGLGNYIVELPNYTWEMGLPFRFTDSAENYLIHAGAELGLIGMGLFLWMLWIIIRQTVKNIGIFDSENRNRFIYYGAAAGIFAVLINFLVHSYVGSFETKYFFWLLVAVAFSFSEKTAIQSKEIKKPVISNKFFGLILILLFAGIHTWNSIHSLSIDARHEEVGWDLNFGMYPQETDPNGFAFRWAKQNAGICERIYGPRIVIPLRASNPDIKSSPVLVKIYEGDLYFHKKKLLDEIVLTDNSWIYQEYQTPDRKGDKIYLVFETDRSWQPKESLGVPDLRWLAVSVGEIWFEYPKAIEEEKISHSETILNTKWEGRFKEKLWQRGISTMRFRVEQKNVIFKLNFKSETAFGVGPYLHIRLDGLLVAKTMFNKEGWVSMVIKQEVDVGEHELSVEFLNDYHDPVQNEDRNIYLGELEILYLR